MRPDGLAELFHQLHVAHGIETALHLDGLDALAAGGDGLVHGGFNVEHDAETVRDGDGLAVLTAEQLVNGLVERLAHDVVERDVDGGLGVNKAADGLVHLVMDEVDVKGIHAHDGGEEVVADDDLGRLVRLAVVAAEIAAPLRHGGGFAVADDAVVGLDFQNDPALPDVGGAARPRVAAARGDAHLINFIRFDFHSVSFLSAVQPRVT